jgi:hypothetical protein
MGADQPFRTPHSALCTSKAFRSPHFIIFTFLCLGLSGGNSFPAPKINYTDASSVTIVFGEEIESLGLREVLANDGGTVAAVVEGQKCHMLDLGERSVKYIYFAIDPSFKWKGDPETNRIALRVEVEYFDKMPGSFDLQYDAQDSRGAEFGVYTAAQKTERHTGVQKWRAARFNLRNARLINSQNGGADFRLRVYTKQLFVRQVTVFRQ